MGLLSDVFVAKPSEAKRVCECDFSKSDKWIYEDFGGDLFPEQLAILFAIVGGKLKKRMTRIERIKIIEKLTEKEFPLLHEEEEVWVYQVSDKLVNLINIQYSDPMVKEVSEAWGWEEETTRPALRALCLIARVAVHLKKGLLLRISL